MQIRKFKGQGMSGILRTIKEELGPDAVILSTKEIGKGSVGSNSPSVIEVTAATDPAHAIQNGNDKAPLFENQLERVLQGDIYEELKSIKGSLASLLGPDRSEEDVPSNKIYEMWLEMKVMLKALKETRQEAPLFSTNRAMFHLFQNLIASGMDSETAKDLCGGVKTHLSPEALFEPGQIGQCLKELLESLVQVKGDFETDVMARHAGEPKVIVLVGPTGVGKTTTLAKLGANEMKKEKKVTLVSFESEEDGEEERLMHFAHRIGIPALKVGSRDRLAQVIARRSSDERILVDTLGCSHFDQKRLAQLKGLTEAIDPIEMHLVLSASTKENDMSDMIDRFSTIPIDALLFSKIDETNTYGPLFSAMGRKRKPISYLTTGRQIPDDIEMATPKRFAELILQGQNGILINL